MIRPVPADRLGTLSRGLAAMRLSPVCPSSASASLVGPARGANRRCRSPGRDTTATPTVAAIGGYIRSAFADSNPVRAEELAFRALIQCSDNLRLEHGAIRVALYISEPEPTGDHRLDAALAGRGRHDSPDIDLLLDACAVTSVADAEETFDRFYPNEEMSDRAYTQRRSRFA